MVSAGARADREDGGYVKATCMALTESFLIYGTENGKVWKLARGPHHSPHHALEVC